MAQERMITLRLSAQQHQAVARQAIAAGESMNTFVLRRLGFQPPPIPGRTPGRKPRVELPVEDGAVSEVDRMEPHGRR